MIEIPSLEGKSLNNENDSLFSKAYCETIRNIFFKDGVCNDTPGFQKSFPFGFLIYSNAHPDFIEFMSKEGSWEFLDTVTRSKFFLFSIHPENGQKVLTSKDNETMIGLAKAFGLDEVCLNPQLVICDFDFEHRKGKADWEHIYNTSVKDYFVLELPNLKSDDYRKTLRNTVGSAMSGLKSSNLTAKDIYNKVRDSHAKELLKSAGRGLLKQHLKAFSGALGLFGWRPGKIR